MHKFTNPLTPAQVYRFAVDFCQPHLRFRAVGKVTAEVILSALFAAAARISSIHETCGRLAKAPCEETFTAALYPQLLDLDAIQRRVNAALADHLPRALRRRRQRPLTLGIDLTVIAYYGKHALDDPHMYRSQANRGTSSFFPSATAYLVLHGQRFTLAVVPVTRSESLKQVRQELLALVSKMGLKIGLLLLDRGFYSVEVIRYLHQARRPFLMPMVCHGRTADHPWAPARRTCSRRCRRAGGTRTRSRTASKTRRRFRSV